MARREAIRKELAIYFSCGIVVPTQRICSCGIVDSQRFVALLLTPFAHLLKVEPQASRLPRAALAEPKQAENEPELARAVDDEVGWVRDIYGKDEPVPALEAVVRAGEGGRPVVDGLELAQEGEALEGG